MADEKNDSAKTKAARKYRVVAPERGFRRAGRLWQGVTEISASELTAATLLRTRQGVYRRHVGVGSSASVRCRRHVRYCSDSYQNVASRRTSKGAINVRFASRRTAAKFASLFDEAGGVVRDMTEIDRTGEHAELSRCWPVGANPLNDD